LLSSCYRRALTVAADAGAATIGFPAISTGVYGFPVERAAAIAVDTIIAHGGAFTQIVLCCFSPRSAAAHRDALARSAGAD
jgi:O-acetyl-ADP-ribose deacetylase (regulator of RNase III)